jgi:5-methylcytosine-specific restriction endonuclease McrBC GTP-binding regulatory subunit McrB
MLNQILFGPPGTGKTYATITKALDIVGYPTTGKDRVTLKAAFDALQASGQIAFTTFHQSMSYEDFVEGIKPVTQGDNVVYEVQNGIFKQLSERAAERKISNFEIVFAKLVEEINEINNDLFRLRTKTDKIFGLSINTNGNLKLHTGRELTYQGVLTKEHIFKRAKGETGIVGWESYTNAVVQYLNDKYALSIHDLTETKNYVLIIDEINRGNVSQIFGELITLIEPSKRAGETEALIVTLPYSKTAFSVPNNLYLLGTMNTADRSVEALDTALRRRFSFEECVPQPNLITNIIGGIEVKTILSSINERLEMLLSRSHQIGHTYFLNVTTFDDLKTVFYSQIIPLLQEYFFGDDAKIGLVLGKGFVREVKKKVVFAAFDYEGQRDLIRPLYQIVPVEEVNMEEAIRDLLGWA